MSKKKIAIIFLCFLITKIFFLNANENTYINSNNIIYDEKKNIVELSKNSKININNTNILIDKGIIDYKNDTIEIFGNFYLYEQLSILSGKDLKGKTNLKNFNAFDVSYVYNDDLKIDSKEMNRNENYIYFYDNFLTPCELDGYFNCPTWSLRIDETKYNIENDQFIHFDTFLQVADYKLFYMPYFSHYGTKAPRKKGFLTPSIEFIIGSSQAINLPYYVPIGSNSEITFIPKLFLGENINIFNKYELNTVIESKQSGGESIIEIDNSKNNKNSKTSSFVKLRTKQKIDKNNVFSVSGLFTNSISSTRSDNNEPISFEDVYLRLENYDFISKDDYLKTELTSVKSFDSVNSSLIPITSSIQYANNIIIDQIISSNEVELLILNRNDSTNIKPSQSTNLNISNEFINSYNKKYINAFNKVIFKNSLNEYLFNKNSELNDSSVKSSIIFSTDLHFNTHENLKPRLKFILPIQLANTNKAINEDSNSLTFNYENQYSENRFFGNNLSETSSRLIYGIENEITKFGLPISFNINQSYDFNSDNNYANKVNQRSNFSDYSLEAKTGNDNIFFSIDTRLDEHDFSKKEMNYSLSTNNPFNISLGYHETESNAFKELSNDTQALEFNLSKSIGTNIILFYAASLDVKNDYDPYKSSLKIRFFDECSNLDIKYSNNRFNDNFNTTPEEKLSINFYMDYLGFFGYEQSTNLFFQETGTFNYGL